MQCPQCQCENPGRPPLLCRVWGTVAPGLSDLWICRTSQARSFAVAVGRYLPALPRRRRRQPSTLPRQQSRDGRRYHRSLPTYLSYCHAERGTFKEARPGRRGTQSPNASTIPSV